MVIFRLCLLGLFSLSFISCLGQVQASINLVIFQRGYTAGSTDPTTVLTDQALAAFQKQNPTVRVKVLGGTWSTEGDQVLKEGLEGKTINLFRVRSDDLLGFVKSGLISPIDQYLTDADRNDFFPGGFNASTVNGKIYAWPLWVTAQSLFLNQELFKNKNLRIPTLQDPWTWNEFLEAAKTLTFLDSTGRQVYGFDSAGKWGENESICLRYIDGGRLLTPDGRRFLGQEKESLSAMIKLSGLLKEGVVPPDFGMGSQKDTRDRFFAGTTGMILATPGFLAEAEKRNIPVKVAPPPMGDLGQIVTTGGFGLYAVTKNIDPEVEKASHALGKYLTGSQVTADVPGYLLAPSLRRSNQGYSYDENRKLISKLVGYGIYEVPVNLKRETSLAYFELMQGVIRGEKDPASALAQAAKLYQKDLETMQ